MKDIKIINMMNFVRRIDEREENSTERLLEFTSEQLALINKYGIENTFLLQYDTVSDPDFVALFKTKATEKTELGLWYEIVEPLTSACGIPYRSELGWKWDWHIIPGYSMAYTPKQRELLIDEAMRKFFEVFGYYPKTVAGWVIDTHTLNYLAQNYDVSAAAICRDQANTDAYTLLGGYFNQAYYPSVNNIFTPAQTSEMQNSIPVFRLLGPCPIHNYDNNKYSSEELKALKGKSACFTLEPCWYMGSTEKPTKWLFNCFYSEESLGFAYSQIGQENSFLNVKEQVLCGMRMQIEMILARGDVEFKKMGETGKIFKERYPDSTPATAVVAPDNFDSLDVQSVYYDCKNYTANLFRFEDKIFLRSLFLFDERIKDLYYENTCTTFDAIYENLPIVDTMFCSDEAKKECGLMIDSNATPMTAEKIGEGA
ncbi:MAG: hypothetical protein E7642_05820, partial [Ruminococcaceae bacterium]|nr:hypothetical protein [Oscillospiraceae bacterium]